MPNPLLIDSLLLGVQHSFEPDHVAAVSVLASERNKTKMKARRFVWRSSQWAVGHSFTLILFSAVALLLKSTLPFNIAMYADFAVGPIMIILGISAIRRNYKVVKQQVDAIINHKPITRSFWIGMLHGLVGTGGACAMALTLAAENAYIAIWIIVLQSLGIIAAMTTYSCLIAFSITKVTQRSQYFLKTINLLVGICSIGIGCLCIYKALNQFN